MRVRTDYLEVLFNRTKLEKALVAAEIELKEFDFEVIACRGVSGLAFASLLAHRMKKGLLIVRKPGEYTHSVYREVEGCLPSLGRGWIIVDDIISSGATVLYIVEAVLGINGCKNFLGAYLYASVTKWKSKEYLIDRCLLDLGE
jgi:adenine/guanine phosphoribosyltransferase-like PRPP-binding protein